MKTLALQDLKELSAKDILQHLVNNYSGKESGFSSSYPTDDDKKEAKSKLIGMKVLIAYESTGSWGCDSSSFFLLKNKIGKLFEIHGSHCSCFGFEGQLHLEETELIALKNRNQKGVFYCGGYDDNEEENKRLVKEYIDKLK